MVSVNEWVPTSHVIGELQQVSKVCKGEGLLSSFKLVPGCHTHPENQIRSSMIGFIGLPDSVSICMYVAALQLSHALPSYMCAGSLEVHKYTHASLST